jgi:spermidine/putrescine-binding protein
MRAHFVAALRVAIVTGAVAGAASTAGCIPYSTHRGTDLSKLDQNPIEKNKTTERELVDRFGPPSFSTTQGDGSKVLTWSDAKSDSNISMLPFTRNSINVQSRTLTVTVRDSVVVDYRVSDGSQQM